MTAPETEAPPSESPEIVWRGADALRPFLVPIDDLEPFPGNPRQGDVESVAASFRRFGQQHAVTTTTSNRNRIVAGHGRVMAAREVGFTHVAVIPGDFKDDEEARAFLLADNRTHDRGAYDVDLLYEQIKLAQQAPGGLDGTGYDEAYVADLDAQMSAMRQEVMAPPDFPSLDPDELETSYRCPSCQYEWSGNPRPGGDADEPEEPTDEAAPAEG